MSGDTLRRSVERLTLEFRDQEEGCEDIQEVNRRKQSNRGME